MPTPRPSNHSSAQSSSPSESAEGYRYDEDVKKIMRTRAIELDAGFLLPHLRPGMTLLDLGCGPGTITLGLAAAVAPGEVVGVDIDPEQVGRARSLASEQGIDNIRFEVADGNALPFPDGSFDAVYANAVLCHDPEPTRMLQEFRRALRPGGVVGIRDPEFSTWLLEPKNPRLEAFQKLHIRYMELKESPYYARSLRRLLLEAGFSRAEGYADALQVGTPELTRTWAIGLESALRSPNIWNMILEQGWADEAELEVILTAYRAWGERPDAFLGWLYCSAIGWVTETTAA